jgi:hypothetical protein
MVLIDRAVVMDLPPTAAAEQQTRQDRISAKEGFDGGEGTWFDKKKPIPLTF